MLLDTTVPLQAKLRVMLCIAPITSHIFLLLYHVCPALHCSTPHFICSSCSVVLCSPQLLFSPYLICSHILCCMCSALICSPHILSVPLTVMCYLLCFVLQYLICSSLSCFTEGVLLCFFIHISYLFLHYLLQVLCFALLAHISYFHLDLCCVFCSSLLSSLLICSNYSVMLALCNILLSSILIMPVLLYQTLPLLALISFYV